MAEGFRGDGGHYDRGKKIVRLVLDCFMVAQ